MTTAVKTKDKPTEAEIDKALDVAVQQADDEREAEIAAALGHKPKEDAEGGKKARTLAQQLYEEASAGPTQGEIGDLGRVPKDIWTLDRMRKREPLPGDLYNDGEFLFTFNPVLGSVYCQERYAIAREYKEGDFASFMRMEKAYAEIVYSAMRGCDWPIRETVDDPLTGKPIQDPVYDEEGNLKGYATRSVPLPINLDNVKRMDVDMLSDFLLAMRRAIEGEVSTTPSS